ncbi:MAG: hypothetical protein ABIQ08_07700 [Duganella sp.]
MGPTNDELPRHAAQKQFPVQDDCLQLGGALLTRLGLDFHGFHLFCGAQNLSATAISGAYGLTASPTAFLGHAAPLEVLV